METAYVAGPMTDRPNFNFDNFDSVSEWCRRTQGWDVSNPHEHDQEAYPGIDEAEATKIGDVVGIAAEVGFDFKQAMQWDLVQVAQSDHLVLLPEWETSTGARAERFVGEMTGSRIWLAHRAEAIIPEGTWSEWYITLDPEQKRLTGPTLMEPATMSEVWDANPGFAQAAASLQPTPTPVVPAGNRFDGPAGDFPPFPGDGFITKDSGVRKAFASGMVRDTDEGKPRFDLIPVGPLKRLAELYARGAVKYGEFNWQKADSPEEMQRFKASMFRHLMQALNGETDEDHWSAVAWNVFAVVWLSEKLSVRENG